MQTSRFQLGLIAALAVGLGFSLASSQAVGYPAGAAVSMGVNPISSWGGDVPLDTPEIEELFVSGASGPFIVTDVVLTMSNCGSTTENSSVSLRTFAGQTLAKFRLSADRDGDPYAHGDDGSSASVVSHSYSSGIAVAPSTGVYIYRDAGCSVSFSLSGYQAHG